MNINKHILERWLLLLLGIDVPIILVLFLLSAAYPSQSFTPLWMILSISMVLMGVTLMLFCSQVSEIYTKHIKKNPALKALGAAHYESPFIFLIGAVLTIISLIQFLALIGIFRR